MEKDLAEHDDILTKLVKEIHLKVNKKDHNNVAKDVERLDECFRQLLDQVNNIKIPDQVVASDDSGKYRALERMVVAMDEKVEQTKEDFNKRLNEMNKLIEIIKEEVDTSIEEQEKQLMKTISRTNVCEFRIGVLEKEIKGIDHKPSGTVGDLDMKEAMKALKALETKINQTKDGKISRVIYRSHGENYCH